MANTLIPIEERNLTPEQVERLEHRYRLGQLLLVICFQTLIISFLLLLWSGQDATLTYGWIKPMVIWNTITFTIALVTGRPRGQLLSRPQRVLLFLKRLKPAIKKPPKSAPGQSL